MSDTGVEREGPAAVTTRAVSALAGVQPMAIYRTFGDMEGLVEAATLRGFAAYRAEKRKGAAGGDPVDALRRGWDMHVQFGLDHPHVYVEMFGCPRPGRRRAAVRETRVMLIDRLIDAARAGRLRVSPEAAASAIHAGAAGTVLTLIEMEPEARDAGLSARMREAVLAAVTTDAVQPAGDDLARHAVAVAALVQERPTALTDAERVLLGEWLRRLAATPAGAAADGE